RQQGHICSRIAESARAEPTDPSRPHSSGVELSEGEIGAGRLPGAGGHQLSGERPIESLGRLACVQSAAAVFLLRGCFGAGRTSRLNAEAAKDAKKKGIS